MSTKDDGTHSMNPPQLQNILDASFDAGFLVEGETGTILYANDAAQELFGGISAAVSVNTTSTTTTSSSPFESASFSTSRPKQQVDFYMSFWTYSLELVLQNDDEYPSRTRPEKDTMTWSEVLQYISHNDFSHIPDEWIVTGRRSKTSFPGVVKLKQVASHLYLLYIRHSDHHDATTTTTTTSCARSLASSSRRTRRTSMNNTTASHPPSSYDDNDDPMMAMDARTGTILMFNQAAVDTVDWCREEWVGKSVLECLMQGAGQSYVASSTMTRRPSLFSNDTMPMGEPALTVDEEGRILSVNSSARERISWCRDELMGQHVSCLAGGEDHVSSRRNKGLRRWPFGQSARDDPHRDAPSKPSPQVLRVFVRPPREGIPDTTTASVTLDPFASPSNQQHPMTEALTVTSDAQQRESILAAVLDASLDPLFQINEHGIIQAVNQAATRLFGWRRSDFLGNNISMICGGSHGAKHDGYMARYLATGETRVIGRKRELVAKRQDGSEFPIELAVVEVDTFLGDERLFCGFVRDLSTLKKKERLMAELVEASLDPMFKISESGRIRMVNEAAVRKFGWTREEFLGSNISIICGGFHAKNHDAYMKRYLSTGETRVIGKNRELPAKHKDGTEFPIELAVVELQTGADEERLFCGFVHDLSARRKQDVFLRGTIDVSLDPLVQINERGTIQMINKATVRHFGWTESELLGQNISIICGGGHGKHHDQYIQRYLKTGETRAMGKKRQVPARRKDGSEFMVELALCELEVQDGKDRMFCGFMRDLTKQKEYEDEIQRREAFTNKIIESSPDSLFVIDTHGRIVRINIAAVEKFGWEASALEGRFIRKVLTSSTASGLANDIDDFLRAGLPLPQQKEGEGVTKAGTVFPLSLRTGEVKGPAQEDFFAIYAEDLTDKKLRTQAEIEKAAAEVLLFNVLPEQIAAKLKADPSHIAESHSDAAILFADIVGFTSMSNSMKPEEVVSMLNELFSMFDGLVEQYHPLTKIKTIGDCYMATIVPEKHHLLDVSAANCATICHFALDMIDALENYNLKHPDRKLNLRVGINAGEVVAGVVGTKRFLYDLWGDAVNLASRMESTGVPGKIQITPHVAKLLEDDFVSEKRGTVHVKGIGEMETYFLMGRKTRPVKSPVPSPRMRKEYTLVVDDGSQMDFARSLRVLELSNRDRSRSSLLLAGSDDDDSLDDMTAEKAFEFMKRKGK